MREEIEIDIKKKKGLAYTGTITFKEAKLRIYKNVLGFEDINNPFSVILNRSK